VPSSSFPETMPYYIGLMSGTSLDAVDAALVNFSDDTVRLIKAINFPLPTVLRETLKTLCTPGDNEIEQLGLADIQLASVFAEAVTQLLKESDIEATQVQAIGSHGQTLRHRPKNGSAFTLQIGDPNTLAELTGITTVADFRRRDMAVGGQGAPLAPAFHAAMFGSHSQPRVILNIGGIANVTLLAAAKNITTGFDTGPGNGLMDAWVQRHLQQAYDDNGQWAASGTINQLLLDTLLQDDFFQRTPPKSTGREHFNLAWLDTQLVNVARPVDPADVQATLSELTAVSIQQAVTQTAPQTTQIVVCGGGSRNADLMSRLGQKFTTASVITTDELGLSAEWVEAVAFAWLARETLAHRPGNLPAVTGAKRPVILGGIYQV